MKTCPHCKGHKVIMFDADNDLCQDCDKWFPAVEDVKSPSDVSILVKGFEKIIGIVKRYRGYDGQTSIGNHIENECNEILARHSSLTGQAGKEVEETKRDPFIEKHLAIIWEKTKEAQIERFIKPMFDSLSAASISYFLEKGTINGGFLVALNNMMEAVKNWKSGEIKRAAPTEKIDASISEREEKTQEDIDNLAISFAVWCMGPEGEMYRATRMSAGQLLRTYKDRPYINVNSNDQ